MHILMAFVVGGILGFMVAGFMFALPYEEEQDDEAN